MSDLMTFEEIQQNYDGEWALIAYTATDENSPVIKGKVLAHSLNKEEIYQALESVTEEHLAIEHLVQVPENLDLIL
ncbi:MAG: hypothetical protein QNJ55_20940 [Xenococcus sp. MO_188.B8]|nr:hypothetical protein [Xenococcus sp. MO_188.B8]